MWIPSQANSPVGDRIKSPKSLAGPSLHDPCDALDALRECYKRPTMEFKSDEQCRLVQLVLDRKQDLIAILPTGGGKSAAFEVAAMVEQGLQTVVVVPFLAIIQDILQRVRGYGIKACKWSGTEDWPPLRKAKLVLVVYESAAAAKFKEYDFIPNIK